MNILDFSLFEGSLHLEKDIVGYFCGLYNNILMAIRIFYNTFWLKTQFAIFPLNQIIPEIMTTYEQIYYVSNQIPNWEL